MTREGFNSATEEFTLASGETRALRLSLRPIGPVAPADNARPLVAVDPGAAATPASDGQAGRAMRTMAWVAAGGALVMLGGATAAVAVREGAVGRFNDDVRCLPDNGLTRAQNCHDDEAAAETAGALAWVGFAAGGALAVTSAVLFLMAPGGHRESARRMRCGAGPGLIGVACGATF